MIVRNGKCYPDHPQEMLKIIKAESCGGYLLRVEFNTCETRIFDGQQLLRGEVFAPLKDLSTFNDFSIDFETLTWLNGELDVAPEFVYENSRPISNADPSSL